MTAASLAAPSVEIAAVSFSARVLFETMIGPFGDGGSDFNGDGKADIVASNRCLHTDYEPIAPRGEGPRSNFISAIAPCSGAEFQRWNGGRGFGYRVALGGDADGDGCGDLLETTGDIHADDSARVQVLSGRTGQQLLSISGRDLGDDLAWIGDINSDGHGDFACTAVFDGNGDASSPRKFRLKAGSFGFELRSGQDGTLLSQHLAPSESFLASYLAVEPLGDLDLDGVPDVLAALPGDSPGGQAHTLVTVVSGSTGAVITQLPEVPVSTEAHEAIAAAGDLDSDGLPDIVVGSEGNDRAAFGQAFVVSPATHRVLHRWTGGEAGDHFGWSVAGLGDATGDGVPDIAVGAPRFNGGAAAGYVTIFSGRDGRVLASVDGQPDPLGFNGGKFGLCVRAAGDVDGDGRGDVLIGEERAYNRHWPDPDRTVVLGLAPR